MKLVAVIAALAATVSLALAHSFYPNECCSGNDCAPIAEYRVTRGVGGYVIDDQHFVPFKDVRRSHDEDYHACFPYQKFGCFFAPLPPGT